MVTGAGLIGEYYKNETSFKNYMPDYVVASEQISFNNRRLDDNRLFSYARWMGYLSFPHTTTFHIEIVGIEGKCKLLMGMRLFLTRINIRQLGVLGLTNIFSMK
jgi:hypothetical protein